MIQVPASFGISSPAMAGSASFFAPLAALLRVGLAPPRCGHLNG
jgi:hypothetical protein